MVFMLPHPVSYLPAALPFYPEPEGYCTESIQDIGLEVNTADFTVKASQKLPNVFPIELLRQ